MVKIPKIMEPLNQQEAALRRGTLELLKEFKRRLGALLHNLSEWERLTRHLPPSDTNAMELTCLITQNLSDVRSIQRELDAEEYTSKIVAISPTPRKEKMSDSEMIRLVHLGFAFKIEQFNAMNAMKLCAAKCNELRNLGFDSFFCERALRTVDYS